MPFRQARCGLHDRPRVRGSSRVDGVKGERPERVGRQIPVVGLAGGPERQVVVDLGPDVFQRAVVGTWAANQGQVFGFEGG